METATSLTQPLAIPATPAQVTCEWLNEALSLRYPGVRLRSAAIETTMEGACMKLRLRVAYANRPAEYDLPETFIVKGNFGRRGPDLDFMFEDEMRAYRDVVGTTGVNTPRCFFAGGAGGKTMLVIEDLATPDCRFGSIERSMSFVEAKGILKQLATLHATFWNSPKLQDGGELAWISRSLDTSHLAYIRALLKPERWAHFCELPRAMAVSKHLTKDPARLDRALLKQHAFHRLGPQTICHGDAHSANMYFNSKGGGLFDWALRRGPWYHDVSYFLVIALDVEDRRRWEGALLQYYLDELAARGATPPSFDEALYCHRREIIFGTILFVANGEMDDYWKETANCAAAFRFGLAAQDCRMLEAIESGPESP